MDKEKYLKYRENRELYDIYEKEYHQIEYLLRYYACFFKEDKSLLAIKRIKEYYNNIAGELNKLNREIITNNFVRICKHEILTEFYQGYYCPLCGSYIDDKIGEAIIITSEANDLKLIINNVVKKIVKNDLNLFMNFEDEFVKEMDDLGIKSTYTLRRNYVKKGDC